MKKLNLQYELCFLAFLNHDQNSANGFTLWRQESEIEISMK